MEQFFETIIIFMHIVIVLPTVYVILFSNNIAIIGLLTFILLLVYLQVVYCGCILNKYENNASIKIISHLFGTTSITHDDLTKILVLGSLLTSLFKLTVLSIFPNIANIVKK